MWPDRAGIAITAVIVALLAGATVAVYAYDPAQEPATAVGAADGQITVAGGPQDAEQLL